ncbi:MAG: N-acetylglucosamine-specific PTS transporter subunit IIBC [Lachnospiraceae bacterium]|nr:N-acetylglucosamine-specific PTS transporter subunit IIBC [Lachnospiraceae bacterium]
MMKSLQRLGKALMLPVAVLPAGGLLIGIGYALVGPTWAGTGVLGVISTFLIAAGGGILDNLALLFAVGLSFGLSKDQNGSAALSGLVGWLVLTNLLSPGTISGLWGRELSTVEGAAFGSIENAFIGILIGCIVAFLYNRFHQKELPAAFAFFSGRRFIPILTTLTMAVLSLILMVIWPLIFSGLVAFGEAISGLGAFGAGLYGFFNRLLIPTGLHHALNQVFWFDLVGINDLGKFWGGLDSGGVIGQTGMYMAGFFPVMMFGLPGACLAMYRTAKTTQKKVVAGLLGAAALTAFVTGVTEPVEFSFMFLAPALFVIHAVLAAISLFLAATFQWLAGFTFSAGAIDLVLSTQIPYAVNWWMLIVLGVVYFFVYYFLFSFVIKKFNLKTPGREDEEDLELEKSAVLTNSDYVAVAAILIEGLGGKDNIDDIDYCATRVRTEIKDYTAVSEKKIKSAGIAGVIRPSKTAVQIVVGTKVQFVADEMKRQLEK